MNELPPITPSRLGGDVAVDFLNTVDWRLDPARRRERLVNYQHVLAWCLAVGLTSQAESDDLAHAAAQRGDEAATEHQLVLGLRDDTYECLNGTGAGASLQHHLRHAHAASALQHTRDGRWSWGPEGLDLTTPRHRIALALGRLLTSDEVTRFHRCEDQHCGWVFLDRSRQRNRRWCSSADCGNRNRVRSHYERAKGL